MKHQPSARARARLKVAPAIIATGALVLASSQLGWNSAATAADHPSTAAAAPSQSGGEQLDRLVAPIALYPDQLLAEILAAATYPTEVVEADRWVRAHSRLKGQALAEAVNAEPWDASVKAMVEFPRVLTMMSNNLSWTVSLGGAYVRDSQSVMSAIQQLRARAEQAGNLKDTPQEDVTNEGETIVIEPSNPDVLYAPEYDPWLVYGEPMALYPGWLSDPLFIGGTGIYFGVGATIGTFGGFGWGWDRWRPDWHGHDVLFHHHPYAPHGLAWVHDRPGGFGHPEGIGRPGGFGRGPEGFGHPAAFGHPGEIVHGVGFSGGFHPDTFPHGPTPGFAGDRFAAPGGFAHAAAPDRFAPGGRAAFGGFRGATSGGFHGGGAHFGGPHFGGPHFGGAHFGGAHFGGAHFGGAHGGGGHR
jgi:hypothetical protein